MAGEKLNHVEVQKRVDKCMQLRYYSEGNPILQKQWIQYCHENYGDKSEQTYHKYWADARDKYEENWRAKLQKMLDPAMNELFSLLADDDAKVRQRAVDQIVKYTGNDIEKIEAKIDGSITLNWGDSIEGNDPGDEQL
jgi:hypothetical protein